MKARDVALEALGDCRRSGAWSDEAIRKRLRGASLSGADSALATRLFYSVVQNRMLLDFYIECYLSVPLRSVHPVLLDILRLGVCQLLFFDKIPVSAAVNEAVEQTKKRVNLRASGMTNGVLRTISRNRNSLPKPPSLSVQYSCPQPITELLRGAVGEDNLEAMLKCQNEAPAITVRTNTLKVTSAELLKQFSREGVEAVEDESIPDCLIIRSSGDILSLTSFRAGLYFVQDPASMIAVYAASPKPGMKVLDCCAAPGGKSFSAAMLMENRGSILSCDVHSNKIALISEGAARLGISCLQSECRDASVKEPAFSDSFDLVICDVPCSGLGVIRKKPDIRYKNTDSIAALPAVQLRILENQAEHVKPGGTLLYSTCTILPQENERLTEVFLQTHPDYSVEPVTVPLLGATCGQATLLPFVHGTDGFYFCRMRKRL